jgi:hypothetical protein
MQEAESSQLLEDSLNRATSLPGSVSTSVHLPLASTSDDGLDRVLDLIRRGSHPLDLYVEAGLYGRLLEPVGRVLDVCWKLHGQRSQHRPNAGSDGQNARASSLSMDTFVVAVRLAPVCEPGGWVDESGRVLPTSYEACPKESATQRCILSHLFCYSTLKLICLLKGLLLADTIAERLARLNIHNNRAMVRQALQTQLHFIQARPKYRNAIVVAMCRLVKQLPWSVPEHRRLVKLLIRLMRHWLSVLAKERDMQEAERNTASAPVLDVVFVEGYGLLLLCSPDRELRSFGWDVLSLVRQLDMCVCTSAACNFRWHRMVARLSWHALLSAPL